MTARLEAPAKLNLGLRVVGRRSDGYHLLESLFVPLDLADEVRVSVRAAPAARVELRLSDPGGLLAHDPDPDRNLATRAARRFLEAADQIAEVEIHLEKRIPAGAGLGGGSSDAGAVLRALATAFPGALSPAALAALALDLGADVPFFLDPRPSWVSGIGEEIEAIGGPFPAFAVLLATPSPALSTALVFQRFAALTPELTADPPRRRIRASRGVRAGVLVDVLGAGAKPPNPADDPLRNDLEPVAVALRPEIGHLRETMLSIGARAAAMSGSGPSVFGVFENREAAVEARSRVEWAPGTQVHVSRALH